MSARHIAAFTLLVVVSGCGGSNDSPIPEQTSQIAYSCDAAKPSGQVFVREPSGRQPFPIALPRLDGWAVNPVSTGELSVVRRDGGQFALVSAIAGAAPHDDDETNANYLAGLAGVPNTQGWHRRTSVRAQVCGHRAVAVDGEFQQPYLYKSESFLGLVVPCGATTATVQLSGLVHGATAAFDDEIATIMRNLQVGTCVKE
ncbi:hypothetical protein DFR70_119113 [Nocardia tenerifensis]|uniref:Lipoprotein n=1 Tax=Nocardia tenerifensis TaxID=228006 RepID=A0A318JPD4_9NOCA|nr:hypothetical protein [Nocardia tenerifensis]PXX56561.1 hypothetical protein DFR70_119113 [Nocardia tenerifensis]